MITRELSVKAMNVKFVFFKLVLWHTNHFLGYIMPNAFYTYILNIYDLVGVRFMAYQPFKVI